VLFSILVFALTMYACMYACICIGKMKFIMSLCTGDLRGYSQEKNFECCNFTD